MPPIDQNRPFEDRLGDFGKELGGFLGKVWKERKTINLKDFDKGTWGIYDMYSGTAATLPGTRGDLRAFTSALVKIAGKFEISPQSGVNNGAGLADFSTEAVDTYAVDLWTDFFHVLASPQPAEDIRARVYVHAADSKSGLEIMKVIIGQFGKNKGLWEAKICGPGAARLDTIVAYLYDTKTAEALVKTLNETAAKKKAWFTDKLPPLVRREGPGIGSADEPPAIEIYSKKGNRHSFGSFFSTLCWIALKTTPKVGDKDADGRHFLDNILYSLRLLEVDPAKPQRFPAAKKLEDWYKAVMQ